MYYLYAFQSNIDHNNINLQSLLRREKIQKATYKVLVDLMNTNAGLDTVKWVMIGKELLVFTYSLYLFTDMLIASPGGESKGQKDWWVEELWKERAKVSTNALPQ